MYAATKDALDAWFDAVEETIAKFDIHYSDIYNMDETGFAIGSMDSTRVIVDSTVRTHWKAMPGRQEWVTVVECICADGTAISPFVIFKGKRVLDNWIPQSLTSNWSFSASMNGWTSNSLGLAWLEDVFEPATRNKAKGKTRLLICDGHDSHISGYFISYCMENNIHILLLPPHTSHILQPLDVAIFGPLKKVLTSALMPLHEARLARIQKAEWLEAYSQARDMSINAQNIASAWRGAGLMPLNRKKALRYLTNEPEDEVSNVETTPITPTKEVYERVFLTSSSPELGTLERACAELQKEALVLKTPTRSFIQKLAARQQAESARRILHEHETTALRSLLNKRRDVRKGKRLVLKDKKLITIEKLRDGVLDAEKDTESRSNKKAYRTNNRSESSSKNSSDDEEFVDASDDVEIRDCIIVARK